MFLLLALSLIILLRMPYQGEQIVCPFRIMNGCFVNIPPGYPLNPVHPRSCRTHQKGPIKTEKTFHFIKRSRKISILRVSRTELYSVICKKFGGPHPSFGFILYLVIPGRGAIYKGQKYLERYNFIKLK